MSAQEEAVTLLEEAIAGEARRHEWGMQSRGLIKPIEFQCICGEWVESIARHVARAALRVVLDTKTTCETCGGEKRVRAWGYAPWSGRTSGPPAEVWKQCIACGGSGFGPPAVLAAMGMEHVGWGQGHDWNADDQAVRYGSWSLSSHKESTNRWPVYALPEHTVEEGTQ